MAAILAKKLGMTQRFLDDGRVERVTVLEAGPCPVTGIRTQERDGYEAVQLAFGATKEKHLSKPELGHLKKADAPPMRHLVEFRDEAGELKVGDSVTVEAFEPGQTVKITGVSKGKGFQGTIKRHNLRQRAEVARLAQRARARLDRRLGDALARVQGHPRPGSHGRQARHPEGPRGHRGRRRSEPPAGPRRGARPAGRAPWRCAPMPSAPYLGRSGIRRPRRRRLRRAPSTSRSSTSASGPTSTPSARAPRPPRRAARSAAAAPSRGARRAPAARAPAPAAPRCGPVAAPSSARARATTPSRSTARHAVPRCAARCRCTPRAGRSPCSPPTPSTRRPPGRPPSCSPGGSTRSPRW